MHLVESLTDWFDLFNKTTLKIEKIKPIEGDMLNVLIEIPAYSGRVKYEFDKSSGLLKIDRVIQAPVEYPCDYGFIPNTLAGDGDPIDVVIIRDFSYKIVPGILMKSRALGVLTMEDESGIDEKIIATPDPKIDGTFEYANDISQIDKKIIDKISYFFENYKELDKNKWSKVGKFMDKSTAMQKIYNSIEAFSRK